MIWIVLPIALFLVLIPIFIVWPFCDKYLEHSRRENDNVPVVSISYKSFLDMYETNPNRWRLRPYGTIENDFYSLAKDEIWSDGLTPLFYRDDTQIEEWMSDHYTGYTQVVFSIWDFAKYRHWFKKRNKAIEKDIILNQIKDNNKALENMIAQHHKDTLGG